MYLDSDKSNGGCIEDFQREIAIRNWTRRTELRLKFYIQAVSPYPLQGLIKTNFSFTEAATNKLSEIFTV